MSSQCNTRPQSKREHMLQTEMEIMVEQGLVVRVLRPDGQWGYMEAPPLPCRECQGTGLLNYLIDGWPIPCPACRGSGLE